MKNIFKFINKKGCTVIRQCQIVRAAAQAKLAEENGQFVMEHALAFAIALGVGAIASALVISALQSDLAPAILAKIHSFFA